MKAIIVESDKLRLL